MELNPNERRSVAYFSMEIGIDERIYTYSGGLGVLAGDTIRSAADLKVPMVAITLLYRKGYFLGAMITSGVDLWLNTPEPPMEASGTSGMKAALNEVPNLSVLDGWWVEGHIKGLTGWSIGEPIHGKGDERDHSLDAPSLYDKLEHAIVPLFYHDRRRFMDIMAYSIAINGSFFNTQRMVQEYVLNAYFNR